MSQSTTRGRKTSPRTDPQKSLDRAAWLDAALDTLFETGIEGVKVEILARRLGVTKGSFYWHFRDREDLRTSMVDRWRATQEGYVKSLSSSPTKNPRNKVAELLTFILTKDARHDIAIRAWSRINAYARKELAQIDRLRLAFVESLFQDLGFEGDEARSRAQMVYYFQVGEQTISGQDSGAVRKRISKLRLELLTQKPGRK